jgi:hypothetical protein
VKIKDNASQWRDRVETDGFHQNALSPGERREAPLEVGRRQKILPAIGNDPNAQSGAAQPRASLHGQGNFGTRGVLDPVPGDRGFGREQSTIDEFGRGRRDHDGDGSTNNS